MGTANKTAEQIHDAINAAFLAAFELAGESRTRIAWDTEPFDSADVQDFVRFGFQHATGEHAALGTGNSRYIRRFGIISAVVYVRKGEQSSRRLALVEIIMDFLELTNAAGLSLENPTILENGLVNGWNQINCTAEAHYDLIRTA